MSARIRKGDCPKMLSVSDVGLLVEACNNSGNRHLATVVLFVLLTGCEKFAAFGLTWDDIDFESGVITLVRLPGIAAEANNSTYEIPMSSAVRSILQMRQELRVESLPNVFYTDLPAPGAGTMPRPFCSRYSHTASLRTSTRQPWTFLTLRNTFKLACRQALLTQSQADHLTGRRTGLLKVDALRAPLEHVTQQLLNTSRRLAS